MKRTGAALVRFALEQLGVRRTFGIPGVHTTEIYDELNRSDSITPTLVAHECGGAFMADAVSRTSKDVGTLLIVPAAGVTHAASGIGEAGIDGIPMLIISGGIHSESGHKYQLHEMDQHTLLKPITKGTWRITRHRDIIPTLYRAYTTAITGEPGPVFVEVPYNISNFLGYVEDLPKWQPPEAPPLPDQALIDDAARTLLAAGQPGIFAGWGAVDAQASLVELAEHLDAPVAVTLQGLSAFPGNHPLHTGMGMGDYAVPAATNAFAKVDCLLAIGTRFSEIPTGSYGINPPQSLIHTDINPAVFNANYPASHTLEGDAKSILPALLRAVKALRAEAANTGIREQIARDKAAYRQEWRDHDSQERVNPERFFSQLRQILDDDAIVVADDGNHTFLTAELMPILGPRCYLSPSDFNAMGYCVPGTIGAKLANPKRQVIGIVGDGALLMTGMELVTAVRENTGVVLFVFNDGELSQISQAQQIPYNQKTCSVLGSIDYQAFAGAFGVEYLALDGNEAIVETVNIALERAAAGNPVLVNVRIDYSKPTRFTRGVVKTNLGRMAARDKVRVVGRALWRKVRP
ncbi:acetolactate synthase large subunit [Marinobacter santoriniensis NKSG1]|uniref:Acetolactate synthase large subunit n=1 Tax=Marinobacter santoriniensis NKSG1 TaxID=1288826 RepID=M7D6M9_9GAMM|nr:thiamine pyrophosphate-binding protein [Marinobacter santoriniensis]EMP56378.1 acetolactate synthase large subunit [Marinobacter santoriniensis NKSG1]